MKITTNTELQALIVRYDSEDEYHFFLDNIHVVTSYVEGTPDYKETIKKCTQEYIDLVDKKLVSIWQTVIPFSMTGMMMALLCQAVNTAVYTIHYSENLEGLFATEGYEDEMGPQYIREQSILQTFPWLKDELAQKKKEMLERRNRG